MKGPDAPQTLNAQVTKSRTFHRHRGARLAYWDVASVHLMSELLRRIVTRVPTIAMDLAMRKARADDRGADDDLGLLLAIGRLEHRTMASETKRSRRLLCNLSGRLREQLVCRKVQAALRQRTLDHGGGGGTAGDA